MRKRRMTPCHAHEMRSTYIEPSEADTDEAEGVFLRWDEMRMAAANISSSGTLNGLCLVEASLSCSECCRREQQAPCCTATLASCYQTFHGFSSYNLTRPYPPCKSPPNLLRPPAWTRNNPLCSALPNLPSRQPWNLPPTAQHPRPAPTAASKTFARKSSPTAPSSGHAATSTGPRTTTSSSSSPRLPRLVSCLHLRAASATATPRRTGPRKKPWPLSIGPVIR